MFNFNAVDADIPIEVGINQFKVEKVEQDTVKSEGENHGAEMMVAHLLLKDKKGNTKRVKQFFQSVDNIKVALNAVISSISNIGL